MFKVGKICILVLIKYGLKRSKNFIIISENKVFFKLDR